MRLRCRSPAVNPIEGPMVREMRSLCTGPAAEYSVDSDQLRDVCKLLGVFGRDGGIPRPIEVPCGDFLPFPGIEVFQVFLGYFTRAVLVDVLVDHAHRWFGHDAQTGCNDVELRRTQFLDGEISLALPGEQHVAD